jgi:phospholipid/cholesterol/gamma-HCH transport system substrate-binding protein
MNTESNVFKFRLGLFVLIGSLLFIAAIFIIGRKKNLFNPVYTLSSAFYNVSGLQVGNNIRFCGINVGTVAYLKIINDSTIKVDMVIDKVYDGLIKNDSKVAISSEGIMGDRILVIHKGGVLAPFAKEGDLLTSFEPIETDDILASIDITTANTEVITEQLAEILIKINSGKGMLGRLLHDEAMAETINKTINNLNSSAHGLNENMIYADCHF